MAKRHKGGREFTDTEERILALLQDGKPHTRKEVRCSIGDEHTSLKSVSFHLSNIRKVLNPKGHDIICEFRHKNISYRWVRLLPSACE